jgi:heterotetrameric sarcosine oxidase gamma subunit
VFVASETLTPASAFLHWRPIAHPGFTAAPREALTMASFATARGKTEALAEAMRSSYKLELPRRPGRSEGNGLAVVWTGPDQWLAVADRDQGRDLETELKPALAGLASVVDQSDGRVVVRVSGPRTRDVLAKGLPLDLHPRAFKPGDAAITHASHIGVILWQLDDRPTYELAMFRSYADSFAHWLDEAAAEYAYPAA